jgi:hypothetical protein
MCRREPRWSDPGILRSPCETDENDESHHVVRHHSRLPGLRARLRDRSRRRVLRLGRDAAGAGRFGLMPISEGQT